MNKKAFLSFLLSLYWTINVNSSEINLCISERNFVEDPACSVTSILMSPKEKKNLEKIVCKSEEPNLGIPILKNDKIEDMAYYYEKLCKSNEHLVFGWVPYNNMFQNIDSTYIIKKTENLIARSNTNNTRELCYLSPSGCSSMTHESRILTDDIQILVQLIPIQYEIQHSKYKQWKNVTLIYKTLVAKTILINKNPQEQEIFSSLHFGYIEKIKLNLNEMPRRTNNANLPILFKHKGNMLTLENSTSNIENKQKFTISHHVPGNSKVIANLLGEWVNEQYEFSGYLYEVFGKGYSKNIAKFEDVNISVVKIESLEPYFERPEETDLFSDENESFDETHTNHEYTMYFGLYVLIIGFVIFVIYFRVMEKVASEEKKEEYKNLV